MSPWQAVQQAALSRFLGPGGGSPLVDPVALNVIFSLGLAALLNVIAVTRVRVWNPKRDAPPAREEARPAAAAPIVAGSVPRSVHSAGGKVRPVWNNPILWREICTWSFGKKVLIIRAAYLAVFLLCAAALTTSAAAPGAAAGGAIPADARPLAALMVVSLILVNALSVTSLTNERDSRALDLLLVTDLSPKEIVFGKLGGAFYNAKEMILLPAALCVYLWLAGRLGSENLLFVLIGWGVMVLFAAMLGLHAGITYANSRTAIATSVGTLLFLFLGIGTCMRIMLAFSSTFEAQFGAFLAFIAGGVIGMYAALNWRYRSKAIAWVAVVTPFATYFVITSFLLGHFGTVFLVTAATYGYAIAAMMVPAVTMFDIALGEPAAQEE
jgi:hypothetical protein